jgi:hypothetical protein
VSREKLLSMYHVQVDWDVYPDDRAVESEHVKSLVQTSRLDLRSVRLRVVFSPNAGLAREAARSFRKHVAEAGSFTTDPW